MTLAMVKLLPAFLLKQIFIKMTPASQTAAILFSSGSEGRPKGICLTHKNMMANIKQMSCVLNPGEDDVFLNILPMFHAFGLTATSFMPLVEGIKLVCCPDPTHVQAIGKLATNHHATLLCATSTFLRQYAKAKKLHPLMFQSLRMVLSGAEKLQKDVKEAFKEKFGLDIYEGYGATETSPVASVNLPDILMKRFLSIQQGCKEGAVGLPLPGTSFRIMDPDTHQDLPAGRAGMVLIAGPQVMKGYFQNEKKTAEVIMEEDGIRWYKTGDKGRLDEDGFLTIVDRYSRFAKIGGEMISLGAVEKLVTEVAEDPSIELTAIAIPDEKKGEKVVVLISGEPDISLMKDRLIQKKTHQLMMPAAFLKTDQIPRLGTGKTDFVEAKELSQRLIAKGVFEL